MSRDSMAVLVCRRAATTSEELAWGQRLCEEFLRRGDNGEHVSVIGCQQPVTVADALVTTQAPLIGVVTDDQALWGSSGWGSLQRLLGAAGEVSAVGPVSNVASSFDQTTAPPFPYSTPWLLQCASREHHHTYRHQWREVSSLDPFAFLVRRTELTKLDQTLLLDQVPARLAQQGRKLAVALDTYVHRYGTVYEWPRLEIQAQVPRSAKRILDVGCATGLLGANLKERQDCEVVGVEPNVALAHAACARLDRVLQEDVEALATSTFTAEFDCITCGDVLEHLRDPWTVVEKLSTWLRPGGSLVTTIPNVGHWSIVLDLLQGRWNVIPFGLLCWGHLRFFSRQGIEQLFASHSLVIELLEGHTQLSPIGDTFIEQSARVVAEVDRESLRTHDFLVVARKRHS
jgi:2-polyprenyl-3-methyl-5-hydroxy-6-metoxy-1,4-benzoquinol methylase